MPSEIRVPTLGESVTEATVGKWFKAPGDTVSADEPLCELETDKVTVEVPAPSAGVLSEIKVSEGTTVAIGTVLGIIKEGAGKAAGEAKPAKASAPAKAPEKPAEQVKAGSQMPPSPAARKALAEAGIDAEAVAGSGKRGQVLKEDVQRATAAQPTPPAPAPATPLASLPATRQAPPSVPAQPSETLRQVRVTSPPNDAEREERVRMSRLRQTIAARLKDAQNTAAMLTTFNDVDMSGVMSLRKEYRDLFERRHGVRLGFMGFFVKACIQALREVPAVNAEIDGTDIVYKNYYHIGVAVGTEKGLVVPVIREADRMTVAEIEAKINEFGRRARDGRLGIEEMQGGTFTISNGGVYGSMLSTPILNVPQSGILGMHRIEDRPVARNGQVVIRPMMYLALSYDHRIVDGKEAVTFLVRVKELLEDPQRLILEL
ncbi:MAG: 2-oxoglutarate dehydrogenase complex dihydrolipoyllysine-residue succinyltransferase [Hyphomicrobiaceae bacterium]